MGRPRSPDASEGRVGHLGDLRPRRARGRPVPVRDPAREGRRAQADPYASRREAPGTASIIFRSRYEFTDDEWIGSAAAPRRSIRARCRPTNFTSDRGARVPDDFMLTYRELAPPLAEYVGELGFTHVELMPVTEHPFTGSWGYQVSGDFAPTARYGDARRFPFFRRLSSSPGIGVIVDWVPAHFPGTLGPRAVRRHRALRTRRPAQGVHPDWGTLVFNYGRNEVRKFLLGNALFWCVSSTSTGCASTRSPRCSTWTTRARKANGFPTNSGAAKTSRRSIS